MIKKYINKVIYISVFTLFYTSLSLAVGAAYEPLKLRTSDGVSLAAVVAGNPALPGARGVVFLHQGGSSKEEWTSRPLFEAVADAGMVALALDIRGHGDSAGTADFSTLFDDPDQSPRDLAAALEWLVESGNVDPSRVAVVGASIGANLAIAAAGSDRFEVKTVVALSAKTSAAANLAGGPENLSALRSVYLIAGAVEQDGQRAHWARELYALAQPPRHLEIVAGSAGHGVGIMDDAPWIEGRILDWLEDNL